jgi:hypothetical protein
VAGIRAKPVFVKGTRVSNYRVMGIAGLVAAAIWGAGAANAQAPANGLDILGPLERRVTIFLAERPVWTATFMGDHGPVRVTGLLAEVPAEPLQVVHASGARREVPWTEIRELSLVRSPAEGFPEGSFWLQLLGDPVDPLRAGAAVLPGGGIGAGAVAGRWRLASLPDEAIILRSANLGDLSIPLSRISELVMQPILARITRLPEAAVRVEVLPGTVVNVPLAQVASLRRDLRAGSITLGLADGQLISGRLVNLPDVAIEFDPPTAPIPLAEIVQLEVRLPAATALLGSGNY